jgi:hypothetical protein
MGSDETRNQDCASEGQQQFTRPTSEVVRQINTAMRPAGPSSNLSDPTFWINLF